MEATGTPRWRRPSTRLCMRRSGRQRSAVKAPVSARRSEVRSPSVATRSGRGGGAPALPGLGTVEAEPGASWECRAGPTKQVVWPVSCGSCGSCRSGPTDLTSAQRDALGRWLRPGWPPGVKDLYVALSDAVARASVRRWEAAMDRGGGTGEAMLWRLLRIGSAPYFVLGSSAERSLRLRIATSWDWRQHFQLGSIALEPQRGGQPRVGWHAVVRDRASSEISEISGPYRGALEPRTLRRTARSQGLPRHAAPSRAGLFRAAMNELRPRPRCRHRCACRA